MCASRNWKTWRSVNACNAKWDATTQSISKNVWKYLPRFKKEPQPPAALTETISQVRSTCFFSWYYFKSILKRHNHKELPLNVCGSASDMEHIRCSSLGCHQRHHVPGHLEVKLSSLMENFGRLLFQTMTLNLYHLPGNISSYLKKNKIKTTEEAGWQMVPSFLKPFELFRPRSVWFTLQFGCRLRLIIFEACSLVPGHWVLHWIFKSTLASAVPLGIHRLALTCRESNLH